MHHVTTYHPDDFTLLRYAAGELKDEEQARAAAHLDTCPACQATLNAIQALDQELVMLAQDPSARTDWEAEELPDGDPFQRRPLPPQPQRMRLDDGLRSIAAASDDATSLSGTILKAVKRATDDAASALARLNFSEMRDRFALLYALQDAGRQIAEQPTLFLAFADETLRRLPDHEEAAVAVPLLFLRAQAHQLAGQARLWTGDLEQAGIHLQKAYQGFTILGDETSAARVEQLEAQRRFYTGHGAEALVLARRASATFAMLGLEDEHARAISAQGMAFFQLGRWEEAADAFRQALIVFEQYQLWSNYVSTLNCIGTTLTKMGRLPEARREYAKALRRFSRDQHRSLLPFIRKGLAEVLFAAGRYREAATQAAQAANLYTTSGQVSRSLMTSLFEVESWACAGDLTRARHRLDLFRTAIAARGILDPTLARLIEEALSGASPDFRGISELRELAGNALRERFGTTA